jgi:hypothetical protein
MRRPQPVPTKSRRRRAVVPEDLRDLLEGVDAPPMRVDPQAVVAGGRRRQRRRARAATWALAAAVAVLAVGAATIGDLGRSTEEPAPPAASAAATSTTPSTPATSQPPARARVTVDAGHCHVEYVEFDGKSWGLTKKQQFGRGGDVPLS